MHLRRLSMVAGYSFLAFLSGCGVHSPKSFDALDVVSRGPVQTRTQNVNAAAAFDGAVLLRRQQLAFVVGVVHAAEQPRFFPVEPRSVTPLLPKGEVTATPTSSPGGPCGGEYPPCYVAQRESGNTYGINTGNGYFGRWQFALNWGGHFGLPADITTWTPAQEDEAARQLWAGGAGCGNWSACG